MDTSYDKGGRRVLLGLLGSPIKHSASPAMHEAAGASLGLHCYYHLIDVPDAGEARLRIMLDGLRTLGFAGINVTFPYKEAICPLLDDLSPHARAIGAVNTVVVRDGRLTGHNTDSTGFGRACRAFLGSALDEPVALIGVGGVGRAMAFALADLAPPELRLFDRDRTKAEAVAEALRATSAVRVCASVEEAVIGAGGIVNGTPVGMLPSTASPVPLALIEARHWVSDAVYNPLWTPFLTAARERGCRVMTGRDLAVAQAVDAFLLFTGLEPAAEVMGEAFDAAIARRNKTGGSAA